MILYVCKSESHHNCTVLNAFYYKQEIITEKNKSIYTQFVSTMSSDSCNIDDNSNEDSEQRNPPWKAKVTDGTQNNSTIELSE